MKFELNTTTGQAACVISAKVLSLLVRTNYQNATGRFKYVPEVNMIFRFYGETLARREGQFDNLPLFVKKYIICYWYLWTEAF